MQDDFLDLKATCAFFGGLTSPIHPATLYRGIAAGRYPRQIHVAPNSSRWLHSECVAAKQRLIEERDGRHERDHAGTTRTGISNGPERDRRSPKQHS